MLKTATFGRAGLAIALLSGCLTLSVSTHADDTAATPACVGHIITPPDGLEASSDSTLQQAALGPAGKGGLCEDQVFTVTKPLKVYRVWDSHYNNLLGKWWSLDRPRGPREHYRVDNDICPEWSALDRVSVCTLKLGAKVAIGPGQSVACTSTNYPASPVNQVYAPPGSGDTTPPVEDCTPGEAWPSSDVAESVTMQ